jgi:hypothetical protein
LIDSAIDDLKSHNSDPEKECGLDVELDVPSSYLN